MPHIPPEQQWNMGQIGENESHEFWNDTFLFWELLTQKFGYLNENVYVLYSQGVDYFITHTWVNQRYTPLQYQIPYITDYEASYNNVEMVFQGLATGSNGFPHLTEDDFLFVWTFDHGYAVGPYATLGLIDTEMYDHEFAALTNAINCQKKFFGCNNVIQVDL